MEKLYISKPPSCRVFHIFDENYNAVCGAGISVDPKKSRFYIGDIKENYNLDINEHGTCKKCHKYLVNVFSEKSAEQTPS